MANIIEPKVTVIDYGPKLTLENGQAITPDEFVWCAARITYKDTGTVNELLEMKKNEIDIREQITKSLISSGGSGHASMATTPGFWLYLEGNSSKMVDSMFTGAKFASSLMPSGRRIPVEVSQIVIPKGITEAGTELTNLYLEASEKNIQAYETLQEIGIPKQEASKIVQYGHRGGGFMFMPLETVIHFAKDAEENPLMPREGKEILSQLEDFIHANGMEITYEARKAAPRTGCINPNIFHDRKNLAQELIEQNYKGALISPVLLSGESIPSDDRDLRIENYLEKRNRIFSNPESIIKYNQKLLRELEHIIEDHNDSVSVKTLSNSPWRVWGEVKRHRTLPQTTESVYNATDRAINAVRDLHSPSPEELKYKLSPVVSMPPSVTKNEEAFNIWTDRFIDSINVYDNLVKSGVNKSDAIHVVPRGLKMGIIKNFDLYNLTTGYLSLRLCSTAEPEMRATSESERELILKSTNIFNPVKQLLTSKCNYVGFCPDKPCKTIKNVVPDYNKEMHLNIKVSRADSIRDKL